MKKLLGLFLIFIIGFVASLNVISSTNAVGESFSGTSSYSITRDQTITFSDLQVDGSGNDNLNINIFVPYGTLEMSTVTGLTFNSATQSNNLNFDGSRTNINNALKTLKFSPSLNNQERSSAILQITIGGLENSVYSPVTHHLYQSSGISTEWQYAKSGAESFSHQGVAGYLATITSHEEQDVVAMLKRGGWLGASDLDNEGEWVWVSGPEAGQNFWNGGADGSLVDGFYDNWVEGMPDNYNGSNPNGENCLEIYSGNEPFWNDQNCDSPFITSNYVVEYGDEGHSFDLPYKDISISISNGKDLNRDGTEDIIQSNVKDFQTAEGKWMSLVIGGGCTFTKADLIYESSNTTKDQEYNYPGGLLDFIADCNNTFGTVVRIYYYDETVEELNLRKYNPLTNQYSTLTDHEDFINMNDYTFSGQSAVIVNYYLYDGGELDSDGEVNGEYADPVGNAILGAPEEVSSSDDGSQAKQSATSASSDLASTGGNSSILIFSSVLLLISPLILKVFRKRLSLD